MSIDAALCAGPARKFLAIVLAFAAPLIAQAQTLTIVSGNNQVLVPKQASQPLVVRATDASGAPLEDARISWSSANATASYAASTTTDANGQSSNQLTAVLPGNYTLTATLVDSQSGASVQFTFNNGVANLSALTPAQQAVAHAIDVACPTLAASSNRTSEQTDFLQRCSEIVVGAGRSEIPNVLDNMLNNKAQPQSQIANNVQASQAGNLTARMAALRAGVQGVSLGGLGIVSDGKALPLAMLGDVFRAEPSATEVGSDFSRWGFFANGVITRGEFDANASRPGFDYDGAAITAGVDYRFSDAFVAGIALGYNSDSSDLDDRAGNLDVDSYGLNGYMTWYRGDFYLQASLAFQRLAFDLRRNISYTIANTSGTGTTTVDQVARASPDGDQTAFDLTLGRDFNSGAFQFSPYLRATWSHLSLDGFSENIDDTGAPGFGLATEVDKRSRTNEIGVIGALFSWTSSQNWGVLVPNARLEWSHDFKDNPQIVVSRFLSDPTGTPIVVTDPRLDRNFYNIGFGVNAIWPQGRSGYIAYEYVGGLTGAHLNRFQAGFRLEF
jgi:uncharacterized protein with beta-barrel porin domain